MGVKKQRSVGQAWFCSTGLPSDVVVEVHEVSFHLHKFPLMSKSKKLHRLITMLEQNPKQNLDDDDQYLRIYLPDFPGGPITFEAAAKFCYGINIALTAATAAPLRCAAEYLESVDLISRTDHYLNNCALRSLKSSTIVLNSCSDLIPDADELGIVQRCIDAISALTWPIKEGIDDLATLSFPIYKRVISAMRDGNSSPEAIESSLVTYAKRSIPGISRSSRKHHSPVSQLASATEKREQLETIINHLSLEKICPGSELITPRFLSGLLRTANILHASESYRTAVERRMALQLEQATVEDLMIPNYYNADTLYDVECVERILTHYTALDPTNVNHLIKVGRLLDYYLCEIASDAGLTVQQFCSLAVALPGEARQYDDILYRAVDVYMRSHLNLTEEDRERVCGVVDCRKLTVEACAHAAGNERLPLRAVVGVLLREQMEMRRAVEEEVVGGVRGRSKRRGGNDVWLDMESVRGRVRELERECARMKKVIAEARRGGLWRRLGCKVMEVARVCEPRRAAVAGMRRRK